MADKLSQFHYAGGLGTVSFERFVCLASGPNYLPCWSLIRSSNEGKTICTTLPVNWKLNCGTEQSFSPSHSANLPLSSATEKMWRCVTVRIGKHSQQNEKTVIGPVFINPELALQQFSYNYAMLELPHHMARH